MKATPLPAVDWNSLKTARGTSAARVPGRVKTLARGKTWQGRDDAVTWLRKGLYDKGVLGPAAPATVPLLLEIISGGEGGHLAAGVLGDALSAGHLRWLADPSAPIGGPIAEVREAAMAGAETLLATLEHADGRLRAGAAFALAWLPDLGNRSRPALRARLEVETEGNPLLSAGFALALLCRDERDPEDVEAFREARSAATPVLRAVGALAGIVFGDQEIEGLDDLASRISKPFALAEYMSLSDGPADLPWGGYGSLLRVVVALARGAKRGGEIAAAMLHALDPGASSDVWSATARLALELGDFKTRWHEREIALPEELSDAQRAIAVELARRGGLERLGWGVPRSVRDRRRWLGLTPPGVMEKRVAVEIPDGPRSWPLWKAWEVLAPPTYFLEWPQPILDALSADELLEAYGEACGSAYALQRHHALPSITPVLDALSKVTDRSLVWAERYAREILDLWALSTRTRKRGDLTKSAPMARSSSSMSSRAMTT